MMDSSIGVQHRAHMYERGAGAGVEMIIQSFWTSFQMENNDSAYLAALSEQVQYATNAGIELGGYGLLLSEPAAYTQCPKSFAFYPLPAPYILYPKPEILRIGTISSTSIEWATGTTSRWTARTLTKILRTRSIPSSVPSMSICTGFRLSVP
jgi:hypothetical protein